MACGVPKLRETSICKALIPMSDSVQLVVLLTQLPTTYCRCSLCLLSHKRHDNCKETCLVTLRNFMEADGGSITM